MFDPEFPTFLYKVNTYSLGQHFKEYSDSGKYYTYVTKNFYGGVIRARKSLVSLDQTEVVCSVRLKGRGGEGGQVTGVKIDLIEPADPRIEKYGINLEDLIPVYIDVRNNVAGNILLMAQPALTSAYFYKDKEGSSVINFVPKEWGTQLQ